MRSRDARLVLLQIDAWEAEELISKHQADKLRERYRPFVRSEADDTPAGAHPGVVVLQALGGLVLGAAVIAFTVFLGMDPIASAWTMLAFGLPLLAAGLVAAWKGHELGDAAAVAAFVPLTFAASGADENPFLGVVPLLAPAIAAVMRLEARFLAPLAAIAVAVSAAIVAFQWEMEPLALLVIYAVLLALSVLPTVLAPLSGHAKGAWHAASAVLIVAAAIAALVTYFDTGMDWGRGGAQVFIGLLMGAVLASGILLRHRGLILGAAIVLAVDAIAFAFDVGGLVGGTVTLLAVAGALLWFAMTWAKRIMQ